jgi:hypothetical protein
MQERALRHDLQRSSLGWEVVQLVGLQTLTLAILVRVQASQPNMCLKMTSVPSGISPGYGFPLNYIIGDAGLALVWAILDALRTRC